MDRRKCRDIPGAWLDLFDRLLQVHDLTHVLCALSHHQQRHETCPPFPHSQVDRSYYYDAMANVKSAIQWEDRVLQDNGAYATSPKPQMIASESNEEPYFHLEKKTLMHSATRSPGRKSRVWLPTYFNTTCSHQIVSSRVSRMEGEWHWQWLVAWPIPPRAR